MTPEQRQELIRLLELGEEISPEWVGNQRFVMIVRTTLPIVIATI